MIATAIKTSQINKICDELVELERNLVFAQRSRIMANNSLRSRVATAMGSQFGSAAKEGIFTKAAEMIEQVHDGGADPHGLRSFVEFAMKGISPWVVMEKEAAKRMDVAASQLPLADGPESWIERPEQRGFGLRSFARLIGETGNLFGYSNPGKLWKRMGCAPFQHPGTREVKMGSTWRYGKEGKLDAEDWIAYGYSPRRRAFSYIIGEALIKSNGDGPYRKRYAEAKAKAHLTHPEWAWSKCTVCKGTGGNCGTCRGSGAKCSRAHKHGMLLATKLLYKNLWIEWNK